MATADPTTNVVSLATRRPKPILGLTRTERTPELALLMALLDALSGGTADHKKLIRGMSSWVTMARERNPDDDNLADAGKILDAVVLCRDGR